MLVGLFDFCGCCCCFVVTVMFFLALEFEYINYFNVKNVNLL